MTSTTGPAIGVTEPSRLLTGSHPWGDLQIWPTRYGVTHLRLTLYRPGTGHRDLLTSEATTASVDHRDGSDAALLIGIERTLTAADAARTSGTLTPVQHELARHRAWDLLDRVRMTA